MGDNVLCKYNTFNIIFSVMNINYLPSVSMIHSQESIKTLIRTLAFVVSSLSQSSEGIPLLSFNSGSCKLELYSRLSAWQDKD